MGSEHTGSVQTEKLRRSPKGLQINIVFITIAALAFSLLASWLIIMIFRMTPRDGSTTVLVVWTAFAVAWALGVLKLWLNWRAKYYEVASDALIVHDKSGLFGSSQTVYRYESIISIRMTQGFFGKRFGYGDVHISMPKLENDVIMHDVELPLDQQTRFSVELASVQRARIHWSTNLMYSFANAQLGTYSGLAADKNNLGQICPRLFL